MEDDWKEHPYSFFIGVAQTLLRRERKAVQS